MPSCDLSGCIPIFVEYFGEWLHIWQTLSLKAALKPTLESSMLTCATRQLYTLVFACIRKWSRVVHRRHDCKSLFWVWHHLQRSKNRWQFTGAIKRSPEIRHPAIQLRQPRSEGLQSALWLLASRTLDKLLSNHTCPTGWSWEIHDQRLDLSEKIDGMQLSNRMRLESHARCSCHKLCKFEEWVFGWRSKMSTSVSDII